MTINPRAMIDYLGQGGCETIRALLVSVASIPTDVRWMLV